MNGPAHYLEAQRLLNTHSTAPVSELMARAQTHALLALTSAVIETTSWAGDANVAQMPSASEWYEALG